MILIESVRLRTQLVVLAQFFHSTCTNSCLSPLSVPHLVPSLVLCVSFVVAALAQACGASYQMHLM